MNNDMPKPRFVKEYDIRNDPKVIERLKELDKKFVEKILGGVEEPKDE